MNENHQKIKLLLVTNLFPNSQEPNRGIFNYHIVKELQTWCDVTVIAPVPWFPKTKRLKRFASWYQQAQLPKQEQIHGIDVYHPCYAVIPKLFGSLHGASLYFPLKRLIEKLLEEQKFDLINAHWIFPDGVAAVRSARKLNLPIMVTAHGCDINLYSTYRLRRVQICDALRKSDSVSVVSPALKQKVVALGISEQKVQIIPNGVDFEQFAPIDQVSCRKRLGLPLDAKIILFVGALDPVKGLEYLLEAIAQMHTAHQDLFVAIVGDGPLRQTLVHKTQELNLTNRVTFFGAKPHDEIPLWMNACDLFCLPSLREGWPCVIMEVLACGKPVVASRVGGIPEIVNEQNGYLVAPQDINQLAQGIERVLQRLWAPEEIRATLCDFSWKASAEKYYTEYHNLLTRKKAETARDMGTPLVNPPLSKVGIQSQEEK